jgi:hypothetical protein
VSEEPVNYASPPDLSIRFQRSQGNQPDPAFPQSPGIIFEMPDTSFFDAVHPRSFNEHGHHNSICRADNELICTGCSPNCACEKFMDDTNQPVKSMPPQFTSANYSQFFRPENVCSEQVLFVVFQKKPALRRKFQGAGLDDKRKGSFHGSVILVRDDDVL